jgi:hypothetical protein
MEEHELREAFRNTLTKSSPPTPMSAQTAVRSGRRALLRQRLIWFSAATTALAVVAAVTVSASVWQASPGLPGDPGRTPSPAAGTPQPGGSADSPQPWPTGPDGKPQEDATARAGKQYDTGLLLLRRLIEVVPAGYTAPERPEGDNLGASRSHQATFAGANPNEDVWHYLASAELVKGGRTGTLIVEVRQPKPGEPASEGCAVAAVFWSRGEQCQEFTVGDVKVGVVVRPPADDDRIDQWAAYRHPDGTVVFVAQARSALGLSTAKPLTALPFTPQQLAALATDDRFHLT